MRTRQSLPHLTLKMTTAEAVKTSVTTINSLSQDFTNLDDQPSQTLTKSLFLQLALVFLSHYNTSFYSPFFYSMVLIVSVRLVSCMWLASDILFWTKDFWFIEDSRTGTRSTSQKTQKMTKIGYYSELSRQS